MFEAMPQGEMNSHLGHENNNRDAIPTFFANNVIFNFCLSLWVHFKAVFFTVSYFVRWRLKKSFAAMVASVTANDILPAMISVDTARFTASELLPAPKAIMVL